MTKDPDQVIRDMAEAITLVNLSTALRDALRLSEEAEGYDEEGVIKELTTHIAIAIPALDRYISKIDFQFNPTEVDIKPLTEADKADRRLPDTTVTLKVNDE